MSDPIRAALAECIDYAANGSIRGKPAGWHADMIANAREALARLALTAGSAAPDLKGLDTPERVRFYEHDFYPLSNFSAFCVYWSGHRFDTSEHLYHWLKFSNARQVQEKIRLAPSAHEAFKLAEAHRGERRKDWDDVKVRLMRDILRTKAEQHEYVKRKLLATGDRELVEDSWRDGFWGWGPNRDGKNMLGKLWMEIRAELRGEQSRRASPPATEARACDAAHCAVSDASKCVSGACRWDLAASAERSSADWRRLTGLWRYGVAVCPPTCTDFYNWLGILDAAIDERTGRDPIAHPERP